jgi:DNA-binding NtrC family response regulator
MELRDPWPSLDRWDPAPFSPEPPLESAPVETFYRSQKVVIEAFERDYFSTLASRCGGNVSEMARQSGMKRHHVRAYLRRHGIDPRSPMHGHGGSEGTVAPR